MNHKDTINAILSKCEMCVAWREEDGQDVEYKFFHIPDGLCANDYSWGSGEGFADVTGFDAAMEYAEALRAGYSACQSNIAHRLPALLVKENAVMAAEDVPGLMRVICSELL
jgi:hypothetical protein